MDQRLEDMIYDTLEDVIDPELEMDIVNLGLVYGVDLDEAGKLTITMTLTSMGCLPKAPKFTDQIERVFADVPEVKDIDVKIVFTPAWGKDKMSRYAKIALGVAD